MVCSQSSSARTNAKAATASRRRCACAQRAMIGPPELPRRGRPPPALSRTNQKHLRECRSLQRARRRAEEHVFCSGRVGESLIDPDECTGPLRSGRVNAPPVLLFAAGARECALDISWLWCLPGP